MITRYGERSEEIDQLSAGLAVFRGQVGLMERDAEGDNGAYPSMSSVTRTIDAALHDTGLGYLQPVYDLGAGFKVIRTWLTHSSGQHIATDNHVYVSGMQLEDQLGEVEAQAKRDLIGAFRLAAAPINGKTEETAKTLYPSLSGDAKNHFDRVVKKLSDSKTDEEASAKVFEYIDSQVGKGIWTQRMVDLVKKEFKGEPDA